MLAWSLWKSATAPTERARELCYFGSMDDSLKQILWMALAGVLVVGGALISDATAKVALFSMASGITGGTMIRRPGDMKDRRRKERNEPV